MSLIIRLVSIGNLEGAVSLMLSTPPESPYFYPNALRAVALSSAVSRSLNELAVKVIEIQYLYQIIPHSNYLNTPYGLSVSYTIHHANLLRVWSLLSMFRYGSGSDQTFNDTLKVGLNWIRNTL